MIHFKTMKYLDKKYYEKTYSYNEYKALIDELLKENKTTGNDHSEFMVNYTKLNQQRMKRLDKTTSIIPELKVELEKITTPTIWLVITEAWCGDAAQNVPIFELMSDVQSYIKPMFILRDENPELIDAFLTNGGRAIPKVLKVNPITDEIIATWGPRPKECQTFVDQLKEKGLPKEEWIVEVQKWYADNKTNALQKEMIQFVHEGI